MHPIVQRLRNIAKGKEKMPTAGVLSALVQELDHAYKMGWIDSDGLATGLEYLEKIFEN